MATVSEAFDQMEFRAVLGRYPTGVMVVAALIDGEPLGMAVNSFTSVSLDPPLVAFCAASTSSTWPRMRRAGGCAMSLLAADQDATCRTFARKGADRFAGVSWSPSPGGHPVLDGALAWLDLDLYGIHPAGDHELVLGRVTGLGADGDAAPLVFHRGTFIKLPPPPADLPPRRLGSLDPESPFFSVLAAHLR
jgi:3-hydroxy-9,10-secoandrosta-1,3,5(10)-triene-9,17-dione monooxygenase reductase component